MKVLIVSHSSRRAGAERVVRLMAEALPARGVEVVVTTPEYGPLTEQLIASGVLTEIAPLRWWTTPTSRTQRHFTNRLAARVDRVAEVATRHAADVVLTNSLVVGEGALAAARLGLPHAWYVHEMLERGANLRPLFGFQRLHRWMDDLADLLLVAATAVGEDLRSDGEVPAEKIRVVNYGLDLDGDSAAGLGPAPEADGTLVLFPARLTERKGVMTMLRAWESVQHGAPGAKLVLAGEGPRDMRRRVTRFVAERGLHTVDVPGFVSDMPALMARADVVALPSAADPFPVSILEAMAHAKPVVGTYSGGMADQIADGRTGWLVPVGDHDALAERLLRLIGDATARARMGAAARERLIDEFPMSRMLDRLEQALTELVAVPPPSAARQAVADAMLGLSSRHVLVDLEERAVAARIAATRAARRSAGTAEGR